MHNVVVTGGSRGLGLAIAKMAVGSGFRVIAIARTMTEELAAAMAANPDAMAFQAWDLAEIGGLAALARQLRDTFGPIFGLVNNAGIGTAGILSTMPDAKIEQLIRLNVTSPLTLTKYLVRPMLAAQAGRVVNVSSIVASTGYSGLSVYSATKASLIGFTKSLAREVGQVGVTVNAVAPGFVETDMTHGMDPGAWAQIIRRSALRRMATADDVAAAVGFLLSDNARNITGTVVTIDAGNTA
jgi:3-oxoacyl-[acyl-carrier protein] reductase